MERMKTLLKYLVIFVIIYVIFDFFTYKYLVNAYKNIRTYEIIGDAPSVEIKEAKATAVNGNIVAYVKNNTGANIDKTNVKIDLYNSRGNNVGTKYVELKNFNVDEVREFKASFRATNVSHFEISFTDEDVEEEINEQAKELQETVNKWIPIVGLVGLICAT